MLLQLHEATNESFDKLLSYAKQNNIELTVLEDEETQHFLPSSPLSDKSIKSVIAKSSAIGTVAMEDVHNQFRIRY